MELKATFKHPANSWRPAINVIWYQGGMMPRSPMEYVDLNKIDHGVLFKGSTGYLVSSFDNRVLIPFGDNADLTYYKRRSKKKIIEPMGDFQQEWIDACKSDLKTSCDFEYAGSKMEQMMLGLVAYRVGKEIECDGVSGRVTNSDEANEFLRRTYRPDWILNG